MALGVSECTQIVSAPTIVSVPPVFLTFFSAIALKQRSTESSLS